MENDEMNLGGESDAIGSGLGPAERALEASLRELVAIAPDRDGLMFAAGARAAQRRVRVWRGATLALAAAWMLTVGAGLALRGVVDNRGETPAPRHGVELASAGQSVRINATRAAPAWSGTAEPAGGLLNYLGWGSDDLRTWSANNGDYLMLRQRVLAGGVEHGLRSSSTSGAQPRRHQR